MTKVTQYLSKPQISNCPIPLFIVLNCIELNSGCKRYILRLPLCSWLTVLLILNVQL